MLGKTSGVAVELHCHVHSLSLSVKDVTKKFKFLGDTMGTAREIIVLIKYSPKRENLLGKIKEQIECNEEVEIKANSISKLSETRWTVHAECFKRILDNYKELMTLWKFCIENDNMATEVKSRIVGVKKQMEKFDFFFGLRIGHRLYSHTDNLSKTLQAEKMSACTSKRTAELVVSVLEGLRNEDSFKSLFQIITDNASTIDFIEQPGPPRKSKAPQYSILHYVIDGNQSAAQTHHPLTVEDRYRESYFEAVDNMISAIRERFKQPSFEAYENIESLIFKTIASEDASKETSYLEANYGTEININQFSTVEADILRTIFKESKPDCFRDILDEVESLPKGQLCLLPNAVKILELLLVNPATTATPERSFSLAKRIKTWLRSTSAAARSNSLSILHAHKSVTDSIDLVEVANEFTSKCGSRKRIFGRF